MALYYFDFDRGDGKAFSSDDIGTDFLDSESVPSEAVAALASIVKDRLPDGQHRVFSASVRDDAGRVIYAATLTLDGGWL